MSFSSDIKNEIARQPIDNLCCAKSELSALTRTTAIITLIGGGGLSLDYRSENAAVARRIYGLLKKCYQISSKVSVSKSRKLKKNNTYVVKMDQKVTQILATLELTRTESDNPFDLNKGIPSLAYQGECCQRSYIRGAFLGCGSLSDPEKSYHLEFVNHSETHARDLSKLLTKYGLEARIVSRKNSFINYIKESEQIVDLLNVIGAHNALLTMENIRVIKSMRNNINRVINCETANLAKTVDASMRQVQHIEHIQNTIGLDKLPPPLAEIARLRLENPDISLKELGEMLQPPIGKSGVNHRFKKIENIAENITNERSFK